MAIAIEGLTIVIRLDRAAQLLRGGIDSLNHDGNGSAGKDEHLWRCCFMADAEGEDLFEQLRGRGLNAVSGPDPDMVLVNEFDLQVHPYCEWLMVSRTEKGVIAWLAGTTPKTVIATPGWSFEKGSGLQRASESEARLKFLRVDDDGIEVYFDEDAQTEVYIARKSPSAAAVDWRYINAAKRIPMVEPGKPIVTGRSADEIRCAIDELEILATHVQDAWKVHFMIGKGWQAVGELQNAFDSLRRANELATDNESVPREFAGLCLDMGLAEEAVKVGERAASMKPDNYETLGNLACAYLICGKHAEAARTIAAALRLKPTDCVNHNLSGIIADVVAGRHPQPRCLQDLMRAPKKPFWERFKFW